MTVTVNPMGINARLSQLGNGNGRGRWPKSTVLFCCVGIFNWCYLSSTPSSQGPMMRTQGVYLKTKPLICNGPYMTHSRWRCSRARAPFQARHYLFAFPSSQQGRSFYQPARNHRVSGVCRYHPPDPGAPWPISGWPHGRNSGS
jgi:hypothetical protein